MPRLSTQAAPKVLTQADSRVGATWERQKQQNYECILEQGVRHSGYPEMAVRLLEAPIPAKILPKSSRQPYELFHQSSCRQHDVAFCRQISAYDHVDGPGRLDGPLPRTDPVR
jgi:hypothetical protein